jgi:hypothetical protein
MNNSNNNNTNNNNNNNEVNNSNNKPLFIFCNNIIRFFHCRDEFINYFKENNIHILYEERINENGVKYSKIKSENNNIDNYPYIVIVFSIL